MATLRSVLRDIREKHFHIAESGGSIGIVGIIAFIVACVLLWKHWLGRFSVPIAVIIFFLIPLFGL